MYFFCLLILRKALQASLTLHLKYFWLCLQRIIVYSDGRDWSWCIGAVSAPAVDHLEYVIFSNRILKRPILLWLHYWTPLLLSIYITNQVNMRRAGGCKEDADDADAFKIIIKYFVLHIAFKAMNIFLFESIW